MILRALTRLVLAALVLATVVVGRPAAVGAASTSPVTGSQLGVSPGGPFMWQGDTAIDRELDAYVSTGAEWIRLDFPWPSLEPHENQFNWAPFDAMVDRLHARGLKILGILAYTPSWAKLPNGMPDPTAFGRFAGAVADRYGDRGVHDWEIWNEPNINWANQDTISPAHYADLLAAATPSIRSSDSDATVVAGALSPAVDGPDNIKPETYIQGLYDAGAAGDFDALSVHPYSYPHMPSDPGDWNTFGRLPEMADLLAANGDAGMQIWLTEWGAPTGSHATAVTEQGQVDILRDGLALLAEWDFDGPVFWYGLRDQGTNAHDREHNFGLLFRDFSPKDVLGALADEIAGPAAQPPAPTTTTTPTTTTAPAPTTTTTAPAPKPKSTTSTKPKLPRGVVLIGPAYLKR